MIVRMSKVEIAGPREALLPVLETIERLGVLQINAKLGERPPEGAERTIRPLALDGRTLAERLFLEDLKLRIERLLMLLPTGPAREWYLSPSRAVSSVAVLAGRHLEVCEAQARRCEGLQAELAELDRYLLFLSTVRSLAPSGAERAGLEHIGVEVRDPAALEQLTRLAGGLLLGADVRTARAEDGSWFGLLTTEKELAQKIKEGLRGNEIPEVALPKYLEGMSLADKLDAARRHRAELAAELEGLQRVTRDLAFAWRGMYESMLEWLRRRLGLLRTSGEVYETDRCFVLFGWVPSASLEALRRALEERHGEAIVVEEQEILSRELNDVPVVLRNSPYFRPFELLVRLLPTPRYTSIDPTPYVGIFFPLFFGMILGDAGYGLLLLAAACIVHFVSGRRTLRQAAQIMFISALYAIVFGVLYGEFFGEIGVRLLGIEAPWLDRRTAILPMLYFALAVGGVHVVVGLVLGFVVSLKGHRTREALARLASMLALLCLVGVLASYFAPVAELLRRPLLMALLIIAPILLLTGGLLAPFELLRHVGNVVSYARIMAVGLASVLLAYVANRLAGAAGSLWVGIVVAVLLHAFNMVLGVFAPAIHALRLHYVEFFGKFIETGGQRYQPLGKAD